MKTDFLKKASALRLARKIRGAGQHFEDSGRTGG